MREPATLAEMIAVHAAVEPARTALIFEDESFSYAAFDARIERAADAFAAMGVRRGDRVAVMFGNDPLFMIAFYGIVRLGAAIVPISPLYRDTEIAHILADAEPVAALVEATLWEIVSRAFAASGVTVAVAGASAPAGDALSWESRELHAPPRTRCVPDPGDLAAIVYTSGTTGKAKGAMHSHATLLSNCRQVGRLERRYVRPEDRVLTPVPLCHIFGIQPGMNAMFRVGGSVVLMRRFDAAAALANIERHRCTYLVGAPPMFTRWVAMPELRAHDLSSLRVVTCGAAPLKASVLETFRDATGVAVSESYGLTEAGPTSHSNSAGPRDKMGSIGVPILEVESRLLDEDGNEVPMGEPGEIVVRSPSVMLGYWRNPQATAETIRDGWLHTGDIAVTDADGYYTIVDRLKDMLSVGGFKVWPLEVETTLLDHPGIEDVAIVGMPDADAGERTMAFVVRKNGDAVTDTDVVAFAKARLATYKVPARVEFVASLPRLPTGKVLRRELRERARALAL